MIASLRETLLGGQRPVDVSVPDAPALEALQNAKIDASAIRATLPTMDISASASKKLLKWGGFAGYVYHSGTHIVVASYAGTALASIANTTTSPKLHVVAFESGAVIIEQTATDMYWFDGTTIVLITPNVLHFGNFKQRMMFSHPGTFFDTLFTTVGITLDTLGETALPGSTVMSAKSSRTLVWGGIASDWLEVLADPSTLLSAITDTKIVVVDIPEAHPPKTISYKLYKLYAGQLYMYYNIYELFQEEEDGDIVSLVAADDYGIGVAFVPTTTGYYGFGSDDEGSELLRFALDSFLRERDWGYAVLPGGFDITGMWCMADEVVVSTSAALWVCRPHPSEPTFSVAKIANFGALALGGTLQATYIVANDGKIFRYTVNGLEKLRDGDASAYTTINVDEQDGSVYFSSASLTLWFFNDRWSTIYGIIHDAHNGTIVGSITSTVPSIMTDVQRFGDVQLKCVRAIRIIGSGIQYVTFYYRLDEGAPWRKTAHATPDSNGVVLIGISCFECKILLEGAAGAVVHDIQIDYDKDAKANSSRNRRL